MNRSTLSFLSRLVTRIQIKSFHSRSKSNLCLIRTRRVQRGKNILSKSPRESSCSLWGSKSFKSYREIYSKLTVKVWKKLTSHLYKIWKASNELNHHHIETIWNTTTHLKFQVANFTWLENRLHSLTNSVCSSVAYSSWYSISFSPSHLSL